MKQRGDSAFYYPDPLPQIKEFLDRLHDFSAPPYFQIKLHNSLNTVEWLSGEDLSKGLRQWPEETQPEMRAWRVLNGLAPVFGLQPLIFRQRLLLKHTHRSALGTHCIFGLRDKDAEMLENCFVVHLDRDLNVVMVSGVYQEGELKPAISSAKSATSFSLDSSVSDESKPDWNAVVQKALEQQFRRDRPVGAIQAGEAWTPDWQTGTYDRRMQVKVVTKRGNHVMLVRSDGDVKQYSVSAPFQDSPHGIGKTYSRIWWKPAQNAQRASIDETPAVLRDLVETKGSLTGRFVKVIDNISPLWRAGRHQLASDAKDNSSHFDRVMAYYHIDLVQRYFRDLGLHVLDEYPHLNPLSVILTSNNQKLTCYEPLETCIYFRTVSKDTSIPWTSARDAKVVYHEFVHAVTDAIGRLRRPNLTDVANQRYPQMVQAAAMDEALADYFACSLAERQGAGLPQFGELYVRDRKLYWKPIASRQLDLPRDPTLDLDLNKAHDQILQEMKKVSSTDGEKKRDLEKEVEKVVRALIYNWANPWSHFLWRLRAPDLLGAEAADFVIAHSIFFLTRWSGFDMGVWALIMADRLLFSGIHEAAILRTSEITQTWTPAERLVAQLKWPPELFSTPAIS